MIVGSDAPSSKPSPLLHFTLDARTRANKSRALINEHVSESSIYQNCKYFSLHPIVSHQWHNCCNGIHQHWNTLRNLSPSLLYRNLSKPLTILNRKRLHLGHNTRAFQRAASLLIMLNAFASMRRNPQPSTKFII